MDNLFSNPVLTIFVVGIVSGTISSVPLGPTNLWLVNSVLPPEKTNAEKILFITAITFMDVLYALLALWGYYVFLQGTAFSFIAIFLSAIVIIGLGLIDLKKLYFHSETYASKSSYNLGSFLLGIVMGCNPGFIVYWLMVAKSIESLGVETISFYYGAVFSLGLILADIVWYFLVIKISSYCATFMSGSILRYTRAILACFLIFFGLFMLWDMRLITESVF